MSDSPLDEIVTCSSHSTATQPEHCAEETESASEATSNGPNASEEANNPIRSTNARSPNGENYSSNCSIWSFASSATTITVPKAAHPPGHSANPIESPATEMSARTAPGPVQDEGGCDYDPPNLWSATRVPKHSNVSMSANQSEDSANPTGSPPTKPPNHSDPSKQFDFFDDSSTASLNSAVFPRSTTMIYSLEDAERFLLENQERKTEEFWLSNGSVSVKFNFKMAARSFLNGEKYLTVTLFGHLENCEIDVSVGVRVILLSQVEGRADKKRYRSFRMNKFNKVCEFSRFISYENLKYSPFLLNDRLRFQLSCILTAIPKKVEERFE